MTSRISGREPLDGRPPLEPPPASSRRVHRLERRVRLPVPVEEAFAFFCEPGNLEGITPPDLRFRILEAPAGPLGEGSEIRYAMRLRGIPFRWHTRITGWEPGVGFVDEALSSPYALWRHQHVLRAVSERETEMLDRVDYRLPLGRLGELFAGPVRRELDRIFDFREQAVRARFARERGEDPPDRGVREHRLQK